MKLSNLFWGLLGVMAFSACSNDEIMPENLTVKAVSCLFRSRIRLLSERVLL